MPREKLIELVQELGADGAGVVAAEQVPFEPDFRKLCESNSCGMFGKSWMCPPEIGPIDELIRQARSYRWVLVYQTVDTLEDSYDFEGMMAAGDRVNRISAQLRERMNTLGFLQCLHLGAGGCRMCQRCAKLDGVPCRQPERAMSSLEAYGIDVSRLAPLAELQYIHGPGTVTHFGAVFVREV